MKIFSFDPVLANIATDEAMIRETEATPTANELAIQRIEARNAMRSFRKAAAQVKDANVLVVHSDSTR